MIPTDEQIKVLWETYHFPKEKRVHVALVARVALFLANRLASSTHQPINTSLLHASALLHDIDKAIPRLPGEKHPDTGVRVLRQEGMEEVAELVKTHPLHSIVESTISPKTWEEKLLYLADKMVKYDIVGVDGRFALWRAENLPPKAVAKLDQVYPKVKQLEQEIFSITGTNLKEVTQLA